MRYSTDEKKKLAVVYCSHADKKSEEKQQELKAFITECRKRNIYVCVFESGECDLLEKTKELLVYNYNNSVVPDT